MVRRDDTVCSYIGTTRVVWPLGFTADELTGLNDETGRTVGLSGDDLSIGGGFAGADVPGPCSTSSADTWFASSEIIVRTP
jgi:hypothetical protein